MKLKQRAGDFRVRELLRKDYITTDGEHRVYRVTKRKLTSDEAARILAAEAGLDAGDVRLAGLKDRQGLTIQYMSVPRGRPVKVTEGELRIEPIGFARSPLSSEDSLGNAFELTVRQLGRGDLHRLRINLPMMRAHGMPNYFDDQRFGNLTHGQGWIYKGLCLGESGEVMRRLLGARSPRDDDRHRRFKDGLERHWGNWRECRDVAGRFGAHHSIFEYLNKNPDDFAGAFQHVATRIKLIHLFAWQSHLWNRALVDWLRELLPVEERVVLEGDEGTLLSYGNAPPPAMLARNTMTLPGERLEGVAEPWPRKHFQRVLEEEKLAPERMAVDIKGFHMKAEERELFVRPTHLRVRPPEPDPDNRGFSTVRVRFELPRGSYATLVVKRLFAEGLGERREREEAHRAHVQTRGEAESPQDGPGRGARGPGFRGGGRGGSGAGGEGQPPWRKR